MEQLKTRKPRFKKGTPGLGRHGEKLSTDDKNQRKVVQALLSGPKPGPYLDKWVGNATGPDTRLFLHQNGIIEIEPESLNHERKNNRPNIYHLSDAGYRFAAEAHLLAADFTIRQNFKHDLLSSVIQFSFDLAPREVPGLIKRDMWDILMHPNCPAQTRELAMEGKNPSYIPLGTYDKQGNEQHLIPDAPLFGYHYKGARERYFYLHGFEADRGTEVLTGSARTTITDKIDRYVEYLQSGRAKALYGISNVMIPFITLYNDPEKKYRAQNIRELIDKLAGEYADRFIVTDLPNFIGNLPFPEPTGHLVTHKEWLWANGRTFNILKFLKGESDGRRNADQAAHAD